MLLTLQTSFNPPGQGEVSLTLSSHAVLYFLYSEHQPHYTVVARLVVALLNLTTNYTGEATLSILLTTVSQALSTLLGTLEVLNKHCYTVLFCTALYSVVLLCIVLFRVILSCINTGVDELM